MESTYDRSPLKAKPLIETSHLEETSEGQELSFYKIASMTGEAGATYLIVVEVQKDTMVARDSITIAIVDIPLVIYIRGGDRTVFSGNLLEVPARFWDPNTVLPYN